MPFISSSIPHCLLCNNAPGPSKHFPFAAGRVKSFHSQGCWKDSARGESSLIDSCLLLHSAPAAWSASEGPGQRLWAASSSSGLLPRVQLLQHTVASGFPGHLWQLCSKFLGLVSPSKWLSDECLPLAPQRADFQPAPDDRFPENSPGIGTTVNSLSSNESELCSLCKVWISALGMDFPKHSCSALDVLAAL